MIGRRIKGMQIGKEILHQSKFADDIILYQKHPKNT
jgi:hypothetical protein